jgi:hypothetical protein
VSSCEGRESNVCGAILHGICDAVKMRREKGEGRREKGKGKREKGEGRREKGEGRS